MTYKSAWDLILMFKNSFLDEYIKINVNNNEEYFSIMNEMENSTIRHSRHSWYIHYLNKHSKFISKKIGCKYFILMNYPDKIKQILQILNK